MRETHPKLGRQMRSRNMKFNTKLLQVAIFLLAVQANLASAVEPDLQDIEVQFRRISQVGSDYLGYSCLNGFAGSDILVRRDRLSIQTYFDLGFGSSKERIFLQAEMAQLQVLAGDALREGPKATWQPIDSTFCAYSITIRHSGNLPYGYSFSWMRETPELSTSVRTLTEWMTMMSSGLKACPPTLPSPNGGPTC